MYNYIIFTNKIFEYIKYLSITLLMGSLNFQCINHITSKNLRSYMYY
jgi:hypothetical protein